MKCVYIFIFLAFLLNSVKSSAQVVADFSFNTPGDSCKSRTVQLDASSSTGSITSYQWQFRNKTTGESLGNGTGKTITRNFLTAGNYEVILTVSDGTTSSTKNIDIPVYKLPVVDFSVDANEGCPPLTVGFEDNSTAGSGTITKWEWNYNDGSKDIFNE